MFHCSRRPGRGAPVLSVFLVLALIGAISLVLTAGCGGKDASKKEGKPTWVQSVIYFGRDIPGGGVITEEQFAKFLSDVVTMEFPKGLTAFDSTVPIDVEFFQSASPSS